MVSPKTFDEIWEAACLEESPDPRAAAGELVAALSRRIEVDQVQFEQVNNAAIFLVDLSKLGFTGMDINVFMVTHPPRDEDERDGFLRLLREYALAIRAYGICFHLVLGPTLPRRDRLHFPAWHVVRLYREDLDRVFSEAFPLSVFFAVTRNQIELSNLCPYNTTKEARGSMFVGRKDEFRRLVDQLDRGFLVTGARRIGKTSLLTRAYEELDRAMNPPRRLEPAAVPERRRVFFFNGLNWHGWQDCVKRVAHEVDPKKEERVDRSLKNVSLLVDRLSRHGKEPLMFFFDEFDNVVHNDRHAGWPFLGVLAEAIEKKHARVVIAGYRHVSAALKERDSPLYRKINPMDLPVLDQRETHDLTVPIMQNLGIQIRQVGEFSRRIMTYTAGFPFMVQFFAEELFKRIEKQRQPVLAPSDVDDVAARGGTVDFIYEHFLENTKVGHTVQKLERLCCYLYTAATTSNTSLPSPSDAPWDEQKFVQEVERCGLTVEDDELHTVLKGLEAAAILSNVGGRYVFAFPLIPTVLRRKFSDLNAAIDRLRR